MVSTVGGSVRKARICMFPPKPTEEREHFVDPAVAHAVA